MTSRIDNALVSRAREVADAVLRPNAAEVDRSRSFPRKNFAAMHEAGLLRMLVPSEFGGAEANTATFSAVMEVLGGACASTGMCFLMHSIAVATLAAGAAGEQRSRLLPRLAREPLIMTQGVSEPGTGSHFYSPEMETAIEGGEIVIRGTKRFVTNGGHADWYVLYLKASKGTEGANWVLVEKDAPGLRFEGTWEGMGLAGNNSISLVFDNVRVPRDNLLGGVEGKGQEVLFGPNATGFLVGISSLNVGIAQVALDFAVEHCKRRHHSVAGGAIGGHQAIRFYLYDMVTAIEAARLHLTNTIEQVASSGPNATRSLFATKVFACEASRRVTDLALQISGGQGYQRNLPVERWFRDARAGSLMGPTNELMKDWVGKLLLDMPLI